MVVNLTHLGRESLKGGIFCIRLASGPFLWGILLIANLWGESASLCGLFHTWAGGPRLYKEGIEQSRGGKQARNSTKVSVHSRFLP